MLVLPAVIAFVFISIYGVNVIFWDQWDFVPLFDKLYSGDLTLNDLVAQHNEHRLLVYRVIMLTLGSMTHWNNIAEMYFSWLLLCLICFTLYKIYTISSGNSWSAAIGFIPVTWLMFNLRQFENLLFGIQITFYMLILSFVLAVYFLQTSKGLDRRFFAAMVCGVAGVFSVANGLLIWIIGIIQLVCILLSRPAGERGVYLRSVAVWITLSAVVYLLYFRGYQQPSAHPSMLYFMDQPFTVLAYGLAAIGSLFSINTPTAVIAGLVLAVLFLAAALLILRDLKYRVEQMPFLVLILFCCASVLFLMLGRSGFGIEQALSSRYISITVTGIIGLYLAIILVPVKFIDLKSWPFRTAITLVILFLLSLDIYILVVPGKTYLNRQLAQQYLATYQVQPDENLRTLYPDPEKVRQYSPILIKYKLNVFYHSE